MKGPIIGKELEAEFDKTRQAIWNDTDTRTSEKLYREGVIYFLYIIAKILLEFLKMFKLSGHR